VSGIELCQLRGRECHICVSDSIEDFGRTPWSYIFVRFLNNFHVQNLDRVVFPSRYHSDPIDRDIVKKFHFTIWQLTIESVLLFLLISQTGQVETGSALGFKLYSRRWTLFSQLYLIFSHTNQDISEITFHDMMITESCIPPDLISNEFSPDVHIIAILLLFASPPKFLTRGSSLFFSMGIQ
jgi:hypothetical protein